MPKGFGASGPVTTATTPSRAWAREVSILLIRACGYGECRILPISMPGSERSSAYLPEPVVFSAASIMATDLPMVEKVGRWSLDISSQFPVVSSRLIRQSSPCGAALTLHIGDLQATLLGVNCSFDGLVHLRVSGTAAEIARQRAADVFISGLRIFRKQMFHGHDEAGRAVSALCPAPVAVSFL